MTSGEQGHLKIAHATGYLPIGSSSRRVPQAGAAVPRTGNVPGADLEALRQAGPVGVGDRHKHMEEEKQDLRAE